MPRAVITTLVIALAVAVVLVGCGGDDASSPEKHATDQALADATAIGSLTAQAELERRSNALEAKTERKEATSETDRPGHGLAPPPMSKFPRQGAADAADRLRRGIDHIDDLGWRAFDEQFKRTPFDKAIDELPLRKPPLDVEQWVTDLPPDKLQTKAARERFYRMSDRARAAIVKNFYRSGPHKLYARVDLKRFYGMSQRAREAAVKAFYRDAMPWFKKAGIKDFVLVVTPLTETLEKLPALALGRAGSATLTPLGRAHDFDSL